MTNTVSTNKQKDKTQKLRRIRMHISQTKWLSYNTYLKNHSVVLIDKHGIEETLSSSLISKTQRSLYQIRKSSKFASELIEDLDVWLKEKLDLLETYKILNSLPIKDLRKSIQNPPPKKRKEVAPYLLLLELEFICLNRLEPSIVDYILKHSSSFKEALQTYIFEYNHTEQSKALACLLLGVIDKNEGTVFSATLKRKISSTWLKESYHWGRKNGIPLYPVMTTLFLKENASVSEIKYLNKVQNPQIQFPLSREALRVLNNRKVQPQDIVKLLKSCFKLKTSIDLLLPIDDLLPEGKTKKDRLKKQSLEQKHKALLEKFESKVTAWIEASNTVKAPLEIADLINAILALGSDNLSNLKELIYVIDLGLKANSDYRSAWINLVIDKASIMWITNKQKDQKSVQLSRRQEYPTRYFLDMSLELIKLVKDIDMVSDIIELFMPKVVLKSGIKDIDLLKQAMSWCKKMEVGRTFFMGYFFDVIKLTKNKETAKQKLSKLVDIICAVPYENREHAQYVIFEKLHSTDKLASSLDPLLEVLPSLLKATIEDNSRTCLCYCLFFSALKINSSNCKNKVELMKVLIQFYKNNYGLNYNSISLYEYSTLIAISLIENLEASLLCEEFLNCKSIKQNDCELYKDLLHNIVLNTEYEFVEFMEYGIKEIIQKPEFLILLVDKFRTHPKLVWDHICNIGIISRFSPSAKSRFDKLKRFNEIAITPRSTKTLVTKGWNDIASRVPELKALIHSFICAKSITGEDQTPPASLKKVLQLKEKLIQEKSYLESFTRDGDRSKSIDIRVQNLTKRIKDQEEIDKTIKLQLRRHIFHISKQAELDAISFVIKDAFKYQLKKITGEEPEQIVYDSYLRNALLLTQDIDENKRLLKRLIRAALSKDPDFRFDIEGNQKFLQKMEKEWQVDKEFWLSVNPKTLKAEKIPGRKVHLKLESEPLKILEMGNYFDTCLSFGGENSFSTVTNACDLNKRVLYAFNSNGVVIGRKLIGVSKEGNLVGFRTYSSVETKEGRIELRTLINEYIKEFAKKCNLSLANKGKVEPLSSKQWYDDGVVKWSTDPQKPETRSSSVQSQHKTH